MNDSRFKTSFKKCVVASVHVNGIPLGNGEAQHNIEDLLNFKQVKGKLIRLVNSIFQFLDKQKIHNEHDILHLLNCKQVRMKSVIPASSLSFSKISRETHR